MSNITILCDKETSHHQLAIQLLFHGSEDCEPGHFWGPGLRDCFILHFIISGEGKFHYNNKIYSLSSGQGFLISPNQVVHYEASLHNPWHYTWIGFQGLQVKSILQQAAISSNQPIFTFTNIDFFKLLHNQLIDSSQFVSYDLLLQSIVYRIFSEIIEGQYSQLPNNAALLKSNNKSAHHYIQQTKDWISLNYSHPIYINDIANQIGLHPSYLSRLFKIEYDISLKEYILQYRINRAIELLQLHDLKISEVAHSVGYQDQFVFSKIFKKITGQSPTQLRQQHHNKTTNLPNKL